MSIKAPVEHRLLFPIIPTLSENVPGRDRRPGRIDAAHPSPDLVRPPERSQSPKGTPICLLSARRGTGWRSAHSVRQVDQVVRLMPAGLQPGGPDERRRERQSMRESAGARPVESSGFPRLCYLGAWSATGPLACECAKLQV